MWSKNKRPPNTEEAGWVRLVKLCPCSVCDVGGGEHQPSEAHERVQGQWFTAIALCADCHRGPHNSIGRGIWRVKKLDEWGALAITIQRVYRQLKGT